MSLQVKIKCVLSLLVNLWVKMREIVCLIVISLSDLLWTQMTYWPWMTSKVKIIHLISQLVIIWKHEEKSICFHSISSLMSWPLVIYIWIKGTIWSYMLFWGMKGIGKWVCHNRVQHRGEWCMLDGGACWIPHLILVSTSFINLMFLLYLHLLVNH